ncbi:hypothetical protein dqs_3259 [Azoarcus olearius]|nr:hypothetical protein dqs_3259 [Azoarcus olearius]
MRPLPMLGLLMALVAAGDAAAQTVYRWRDANGQLSYGTEPPPGVKAEPIGGRGSVSVMPPPPVERNGPPAAGADAERLERLERELEEERRQRREDALRAEREESRRVALRERCEREYREPCDDEGRPLGASRYVPVPVPVPVRPYPSAYPPHPPHPPSHPPGKPDRDPPRSDPPPRPGASIRLGPVGGEEPGPRR